MLILFGVNKQLFASPVFMQIDTITPEQISPPAASPFKKRNPLVAFVLSLVMPGLGQVYNGQVNKAVICFAVTLLIPVLLGLGRFLVNYQGLVAYIAIEFLFRITVLIDAILSANKRKVYELKRYNKWYVYAGVFLAFITLSFLVDINQITGFQTFVIPSTSNEPDLMSGDHSMADLRAYEEKEPEYGDFVIFEMESVSYVWPLVGLPGDTIEIKNNILYINGIECTQQFVSEAQNKDYPLPHAKAKVYLETLPNGFKHHITLFDLPVDTSIVTIEPYVVPFGHYYLVGNSRHNSGDSRYIGPVSLADVKGRLMYSYWNSSGKEMHKDFTKSK